MKYINYGFLLSSIVLVFVGLYFWLAKTQIDYAAFFFSLAAMAYGVYLHSTKANKPD
jgi:hypothetical protein